MNQADTTAPMEFIRLTTLNGVDVRMWGMHFLDNQGMVGNASSNSTLMHGYYYDSVSAQQVLRMNFAGFETMDVLSVIPYNDSASMEHFFLIADSNSNSKTNLTIIADRDFAAYPFGTNPFLAFVAHFRYTLI